MLSRKINWRWWFDDWDKIAWSLNDGWCSSKPPEPPPPTHTHTISPSSLPSLSLVLSPYSGSSAYCHCLGTFQFPSRIDETCSNRKKKLKIKLKVHTPELKSYRKELFNNFVMLTFFESVCQTVPIQEIHTELGQSTQKHFEVFWSLVLKEKESLIGRRDPWKLFLSRRD